MSDLTLLVDSLQREVAVPGTFAAAFPSTSTDDLKGALKDAFWVARLDGWFPDVAIDDGGLTTPDLSREAQALVVLYAGAQILRNQLLQTGASSTYKVGSIEVQTQTGTSVMKSRLEAIEARLKDLIDRVGMGSDTPVYTQDGYAVRGSGFYSYELPFLGGPRGFLAVGSGADVSFGYGGSPGLGDPGDPAYSG